ncbi:hypothetical protein ACHAWF_013031 [Thalassiosira exigua]
MSSRKRAKGRQRKAKAATEGGSSRDQSCRHGSINPSHFPICAPFIQSFFDTHDVVLDGTTTSVFKAMEMNYAKYPHILKDDSLRQTTKSMFLQFAIDRILSAGYDSEGPTDSALFAGGIIALESVARGHVCDIVPAKLKNAEIHAGGERAAIKFLSKEAPCACLKKKFQDELKEKPKMSFCTMCSKRVETTRLKVCSKCNLIQFCSKECQRLAWPEHKKFCKQYAAMKSGDKEQYDSLRTGM